MTVLSLTAFAIAWESAAPEETLRMGEELGRLLAPGDVVALSGDLGSGKTLLTRGIAEGMGCPGQEVHSPTFTLVNEYRGAGEGGRRARLAHLDLYRIRSEDEVPGLGWDEYVGGRAVAVVEWAERAAGLLPRDALRIGIETLDATRRRFTLQATGPRSEQLVRLWVTRSGREVTPG
jgi:tRNA threonylcarbamoyladenosine biosynthesis protein TsaE